MKLNISPALSLAFYAVCGSFPLRELALLTTLNSAQAQISPDNTTNTTVTQDGNNFTIKDGDRAGSNLFHSFRDFSVPNDGSAFFDNPTDIANIFSRVTGGNISNIDGLLRTNNASLFLINPAGIIFGAGARLDLGGGSFYGTTADSLLFDDGEFSATDLDNPPLITINAPIGLNLRDDPASITTAAEAELKVESNQALALIGGEVNLNGAKLNGGKITLGGLSASGIVDINDDLSFTFPDNITKADVFLSNSSEAGASDPNGGYISIIANNFNMNGGFLFTGTNNEINITADNNIAFNNGAFINSEVSGTAGDNAGDINLQGSNITLDGGSQILNQISENAEGSGGNINIVASNLNFENGSKLETKTSGIGNAGNIELTTNNLNLNNDSQLATQSSGNGSAGNIFIDNTNNITFDGSKIINQINSGAVGNAGITEINTNNLNLNNGSQLLTQIDGTGDAGNIKINASGNVVLDRSEILNQVNANGEGNAGDITIEANNFEAKDLEAQGNFETQTLLLSKTAGKGDAGNINLDIEGNITFETSNILSQVLAEKNENGDIIKATGDAGDISINASSLEAKDNSLIQSKTAGRGNAGNINLDIEQNITFATSKLLSEVEEEGIGNSGDIIVEAGSLTLKNNSLWQTSTKAQGNAGNITINNIAGDINLDSSNIFSQVLAEKNENGDIIKATGDAGDISINAGGSLNSVNSFIISDSKSKGDSGNITIDVADTITLEGLPVKEEKEGDDSFPFPVLPSAIITGLDEARTDDANRDLVSAADGEAGSINISARKLIMKDLAFIINNTEDNTIGDAGDINITVDNLSIQDNAFISAFTENDFKAGFVNINAQNLELVRGGKIITATDGGGNAGNINLNIADSMNIDGSGTPSGTFPGLFPDEPFIDRLQDQTGLFANATEDAGGNGGNITIGEGTITPTLDAQDFIVNLTNATNSVSIVNGGVITAESLGKGSGGTLNIQADNLNLDNGSITVSTESGTGGNIILKIDNNVTLSNDSLISAQAFNDADGGNIDIDSNFLIAFPSKPNGNDIVASADPEQGTGGNITINAQGVLGLKERPATDNNGSNDIDASGATDGVVEIITPDTNALQGASELPTNPVEPDTTVAQACSADQIAQGNSLIVGGRGGIPHQPIEPFNADAILVDGKISSPSPQSQHPEIKPIKTSIGDIYPARGVIVKENGDVILTAYPTDGIDRRTPDTKSNCS